MKNIVSILSVLAVLACSAVSFAVEETAVAPAATEAPVEAPVSDAK